MGFENFISESEAAAVTGVGVTTLRRFAEAGYFKVETESDGLRLYATSELEKVFGSNPTFTSNTAAPTPATTPPSTASEQPAPQFKPWEPPSRTLSPESNGQIDRAVTVEKIVIPESSEVKTPPRPAQAQPVVERAVLTPDQGILPSEPMTTASPATQATWTQNTAAAASTGPRSEMLEREVQKLKMVSEMHERLLCIREEEIRSLREEREWLRARIEKLEEKGSRDQLLLLSETQTIKALITIQEQRRSPVRLALEWLGFITPPAVDTQPPRTAIDVTARTDESKKGQ